MPVMTALSRPRPVSARALFTEDFDAPPALRTNDEPLPPEPEIIAPTFTFADLEAARADGVAEGMAQAVREAEAADLHAAQATRMQLSQALVATGTEAARIAEASAAALAELLLSTLATVLPTLCARHGPAEAAAVAAVLLPALADEPHLAISVASEAAASIRQLIDGMDPVMQQRIALTESNAMKPGDIAIRWRQGRAVRDTATLLAAIDRALRFCLPSPPTCAEHENAG